MVFSREEKPLSSKKLIQDPPVTHDVFITFEQINVGAEKKFKITKNIYDAQGKCTRQQKEFVLQIKKGMKAGTKFTFAKEGDQRPQHIPADITFLLVEKPHPHFTRDGNDLHIEMFHSYEKLKKGELDVWVLLLTGKKLHIDLRGCLLYSEQEIKKSGKGLPKINGIYGDLIVHLKIDLPAHIKSIQT
jgi:DnaJ-class molecular chaperone